MAESKGGGRQNEEKIAPWLGVYDYRYVAYGRLSSR